MKIAYLITAFNNYELLEKLIKALDDSEVGFFIHIDKKSIMPKNIWGNKKIFFVKRIKVWWGGWSHQQAIINLMNEACKNKFDYYVLCSGTDYPIRPNTFLYNKLEEGGEYINVVKGFQSHKPESRIKFYYFDCFDRRKTSSRKTRFFLTLEKLLQKIITKHNYPFAEIFHGSTWWALSDNCVAYILTFIKNNPKYVNFYKTSWCPEESLIQTIIGNSEFSYKCRGNLTYTDWSTYPAPAMINNGHLIQFTNNLEFESSYGKYSPFFARKFSDKSLYIIDQIEKELRM
jgi:hypothetical protein